ncbi:MAG: RNA-binding cell elongation regulator Jag/EloR [Acidimicrobiales bacterium]|nr:RNA-binding cell elongation regulator Jag/EloR [Acidimicrobiales bacterium]
MEWVESTGSTIEEAKERALDRLGVHSDDAEFEVIGDVKTGLFGRVKEEARVRARVAPATPRAKDERRRGKSRSGRDGRSGGAGGNRGGRGGGNRNRGGQGRNRDDNQQGGKGRASNGENGKNGNRRSPKADAGAAASNDKSNRGRRADNQKSRDQMSDDEPTMPLTEQADLAEAFVTGLAERFGTDVSFTREDVEDDEIRITVSGEDLGRLIGHRGTTAGAIDELVRTVLQRQAGSSRNGRIRVDVGGVRARRAEALANFARAQAAEVRETGDARSLEPMSPADRKVVHDALTDEEGVDTTSEGEDNRRRVVIIPVGDGD